MYSLHFTAAWVRRREGRDWQCIVEPSAVAWRKGWKWWHFELIFFFLFKAKKGGEISILEDGGVDETIAKIFTLFKLNIMNICLKEMYYATFGAFNIIITFPHPKTYTWSCISLHTVYSWSLWSFLLLLKRSDLYFLDFIVPLREHKTVLTFLKLLTHHRTCSVFLTHLLACHWLKVRARFQSFT